MKKAEIKAELEALLKNDNIDEIKEQVSALVRDFYSLYNAEKSVIEEREQEGKDVEVNPEEEQLNETVFELINTYKGKVNAAHKAKEEEEHRNLEQKKSILQEFQELVDSEENLGKLFEKIKDIRESWKAIGSIPGDAYHQIQKQYSKLNEAFSYNVDIYKELRENDLKRNYSLKNQIVHRIQELLNDDKIKGLDKKIKKIQDEWEEIGPTYKEHWEKLKEDYWNGVNAVYDKIKNHYEQRKQVLEENLQLKINLIEKAKGYLGREVDTHQDWNNLTEEIKAIQEEWKNIGYVAKEHNDKIWQDFRAIINTFFEEKSAFYEAKNSVSEKNKELKKRLIEKATKIANSDEFKQAGNQLIQLQKQWKEIGHAGKFAEQRLWKEFRTKCDAFFNARDEFYKKQDEENAGNLELKETLIEKIKAYQPGEDNQQTITDLRAFSSEFNEIGNVPFKEKDRIYKNYKAALDEKYDALNMDKEEKDRILLEAKIESIKASVNPEKLFREEKDKIRKKISEIKKEVTNYENNLGFFTNSKGAEKLLKGVNDNIEKGKAEIEKLTKKLKLFPKES